MEALYTDSEWESYSENSDDEARYGNDSMFGNHARSILSSLDASIRKIDDFLHLDRSFGVGDSVCLNSDRMGQIGRVVKVHMIVDLENSFGQTIQNVEGKKIIRISPFANGDYVVNGLWLGKIDKVLDAVSVLFDDGLKCMINGEDLENANEDMPFPHFPGQRVRMKRSTMFDSARKFCGGWDEGTICQVEVRSVQVNWISPIINHSSIPCSLQDPKDLTPLLCHIHNSWQIGDWCKFQNPQEMIAKIEMRSTVIDCSYVITKIKTKLDVLWQEGQLAENVDPGDLLPVNVVDHDFWPGDIVQKKALNEDTAPSESQHFGVIKFVNAKERMVKVNWISGHENSVEETVSAYELVEHPDYNYRVGEIVLRQPDNQVHDNSEHLSCIGGVVESRDGEVKVRWAHGVQSQVNCTEIYGLDRIPAPSATPPENSDERDLFVTRQKGFWNVELDSLPQAVSGFFTNVISSLFGQQNSYALSSTNDSEPINDSHGQSLVPLSSFTNRLNTDLTTRDKIICEANQESEPKIEMVKQFDFSDDYSDHHYIDGCLSGHSKVGRVWSKKIQQEWKILEENLPDTIYVQVYEQRMDLMRAVIIGAPGTPYQYGLFFFDLYLPPDYPHVPPEVHYHSGGLRLNPNLYESGKVCLSLLKTWSGTENEEWDPQKSTILQLLLSLQALVLNDRPYFNEAGYERQVGSVDGERNAITYNENAFLLSCRSMLYLMKKPPKGFEEFVGGHFRRQAESILSACDAYKSGSAWLTGSTELSCSTGFKIMLEKLLPRLQEGFAELERSQG